MTFHKSFAAGGGGGGSTPDSNGLLFMYYAPDTVPSPNVAPTADDAQYIDSGVTVNAYGATFYMSQAGLWTSPTNYGTLFNLSLPSRAADVVRVYHGTVWHEDSTPTTNNGFRLVFNYLNATNYWVMNHYWTGSQYITYLIDNNAGSFTSRGSVTMSTTVDWPTPFSFTIWETEAYAGYSINAYETDAPTDEDGSALFYKTTSRNNHTATGCLFGHNDNSTSKWHFRGLTIVDMPV